MERIRQKTLTLILGILGAAHGLIAGDTVRYRLEIREQTISPTGKSVQALAINGAIPGPTLRFRVGDQAEITVHNGMADQQTSIHWHGLLLPNIEDGVPYLTTPPIEPGGSRVFRFPLTHPGTYWYHSHTGLQEQRGVYGAIVVEPADGPDISVDRDVVLLLSDWTDLSPDEVMRDLMRGSEWHAWKKGNSQSLLGALRAGALPDYIDRAKSKMPPMDLSDVYYDAFWINGQAESTIAAEPGERIRLRVINAGASSYFYLHSANGPLQIVAADGPAVQPTQVDELLIGMAETYDILYTVPDSGGAWELRATAQDQSGHASVFIGHGERHLAADMPAPNIYSMDEMMMAALGEPTERPLPPYDQLQATEPTDIDSSHPRREIELRLTGDMSRYLWSFDGKTLAESPKIPVSRGEVVQLTLINDTMMHHPIHLHGHFFRLLNGQGDYAPLKHTVDVPPMMQRTIEFLADEEKDWFLHCHLLYHMDAGMARVISYDDQGVDHRPRLDPKLTRPIHGFLDGSVQSHMTMGMAYLMQGRYELGTMWDYGFHEHGDYEVDLYGARYINPDWSVYAGYRLTNEHNAEDRAFAGVSHRLPYLVQLDAQVDTEGDFRFTLEKDIALTDRWTLSAEAQYDTGSQWEFALSAEYLLTRSLSLIAQQHSEHGFGGGISFRF